MWLTPLYRRTLRVGVPAFLIAMVAGIWLSDEDRRAILKDGVTSVVAQIQSREEFQVRTMTIEGASPVVDRALQAMLPVDLPASSFDIDLPALRLQVM
jgi:cell division protein FtsQ